MDLTPTTGELTIQAKPPWTPSLWEVTPETGALSFAGPVVVPVPIDIQLVPGTGVLIVIDEAPTTTLCPLSGSLWVGPIVIEPAPTITVGPLSAALLIGG